jgi:hypothetical protein
MNDIMSWITENWSWLGTIVTSIIGIAAVVAANVPLPKWLKTIIDLLAQNYGRAKNKD